MSASAKKKLRKEENAAQLTEKQLKEQKEVKKLNAYTTVFIAAIAVILVVALVIAVTTFIKGSGIKEKNTVAAVIGDHEINGVEMSYYYADSLQNNYQRWSETYGESLSLYMSMMGLDLTQPLNSQTYSDGTTWADYFVDIALSTAQRDYLLSDLAADEGFTITEESAELLDQTFENLPLIATLYGYSDVETYLHATYGPGASEESYRAYAERSALASDYYTAHTENLVISDADIRAYEADKFDEFSSFSYASYTLSYSYFLQGGTADEEGNVTYTEEEKEAARAAAKAAAESLPQCATVEELNAAIAGLNLSDNAITAATVYNNVLSTSVNSNVRQWMTDSSRKVGDFTVVGNESTTTDANGVETTTTGSYTAYVFMGRNDNTDPMINVRHILAAFEGGSTNENGVLVYSDDEKAAALARAESALELYEMGDKTEDAFADLAVSNSDDTGSASNGGLIEGIAAGSGEYVQAFTDWSVDPVRKSGDTGIIETEYGYHVMYFVGQGELSYRDGMISERIKEERIGTWYDEVLAIADIVEKDTSTLKKDVILAPNAAN